MNLFRRGRAKASLEPEWMLALPRRLTAPASTAPRCVVAGELVLAWGDGYALGVRASDGAVAWKRKLGGWAFAGFDAQARPVFAKGRALAWLDPEDGALSENGALPAEPLRTARDAPDAPEEDPTLRAGERLFRLRTETRSRVTRHWVEIADAAAAPRRIEVASFTLRSDRLVLVDRGGGRLYGSVGLDGECPTGALVAGPTGPTLVLRRRYPTWHEHTFPVEPDLLGHGPAFLGVSIVPEGDDQPRGRELGTVPETWEGLGWRGGPPPYMTGGLGARPVGLAAGRIILELIELGDGKASSDEGLTPAVRHLAAFPSADLC